jgi:Helix-turn-helix domain
MDALQCRRILEVPADASMDAITQAYHLLKRIYEKEHPVFMAPSMDEFAPEAREEILEEIEAAYRELSRIHLAAQPKIHAMPRVHPVGGPVIDGEALRRIREGGGISLEYVASQTHIRADYLSALEDERFWDLPLATVNVRGFLSAFATTIGLPIDDVVPQYMQRFQNWQAQRLK